MAIPHDRLFKELLTSFIHEFIELFVPHLAGLLAPASLVPLDKEAFPRLGSGRRREADLVWRACLRGGDEVYFLIHLEHQAQSRDDTPRRMFRYFFLFHDKHDLPVYPIALLSHSTSRKAAPSRYCVTFPGFTPLQFSYQTVQLNRMDWRDYLSSTNPIATALMSRMRIAPKDRPAVKLASLRQLRRLGLEHSKAMLISAFLDNYLELDPKEEAVFRAELSQLAQEEQQTIMKITTSWKEEGRAEGLIEGQHGSLATVLRARFGSVPEDIQTALLEITDCNKLQDLLTAASTADSLSTFQESLTEG